MKKKAKETQKHKSVIISSILLIITIVITTGYGIYAYNKDKTDNINYTEKTNLKYSVCLKENNYFNEKCLDNTKTYIADLIDYINIDFSYFINSSAKIKQDYSYNITSQVIATSKEDEAKVLYDKKEILVKNQRVTDEESKNAVLNKKLRINYGEYNSIITNFKKDYVLALDARLVITMNINYTGQYTEDFNPITSSKQLSISIPLSEQTISIETIGDKVNEANTIYKTSNDKYTLGILLFLIIVNFIVAVVMIVSIIKALPYKKEYRKKLDRILKEYDRAIVSTTKLPSFKGYNKVSIPTFEEMLDARENLEKPILMYQSKQEDKTTFCIMTDKEVYEYILEVNISEEKKNVKKKKTSK